MIINLLFLPMAFFIGIITAYEDFKYGKIRNKWIKFGLIWGFSVMIILIIWNFIAPFIPNFNHLKIVEIFNDHVEGIVTVNNSFFYMSGVNFLFAIIVSYLMWNFNAWAAGDAKLFIVLSLLIPITNYWKAFLPFFPSIAFLINIFTVLIIGLFLFSLYILINNIIFKKKSEIKPKRKLNLGINNFLNSLKGSLRILPLIYFLIIILFFYKDILSEVLAFDVLYLQVTIFSLIIIFSSNIARLFKKKYLFIIFVFFSILVTILQLFFSFSYSLPIILKAIYMLGIFMIAFMLFGNFLKIYVNRVELEEININDLKRNMILDSRLKNVFNFGKSTDLNSLTDAQVALVKEKFRFDKKDTILIQKRFPFAIWIILGMAISVLTKSTIIGILITLIQS